MPQHALRFNFKGTGSTAVQLKVLSVYAVEDWGVTVRNERGERIFLKKGKVCKRRWWERVGLHGLLSQHTGSIGAH